MSYWGQACLKERGLDRAWWYFVLFLILYLFVSAENIGALYHRGFFVDFSFFSDNKCPTPFSTTIQGTASVEPPYGVAITHGYTISVDHHFNYAEMKSFKIHFKAGSSALSKVQARIYTVSSFNFDGKFQVACRASNFRSDVYNGPVNWDISPVASGVEFSSPDIKEIIKPLLGQINSHALWRHYFFVVIEFLQTRGMSFSLALAQKPYYVIMYADKRPGMPGFSYFGSFSKNRHD